MEHRDEWVSYCPHTDDNGFQDCRCAPDLREVVEENERLRDAAARALERVQVDDAMEAEMILEHVIELDGTYIPPKEVK